MCNLNNKDFSMKTGDLLKPETERQASIGLEKESLIFSTKKAFLGINTKSSVNYIDFDDKEREILLNKKTEENEFLFNQDDIQFLTYERLATAREILYSKEKAENYKKDKHLTDKHTRLDTYYKNDFIGPIEYEFTENFVGPLSIYDNKNLKELTHFKNVNRQHRTFHCRFDLNKIATQKGKKAQIDKNQSVSVYKNEEDGKIFMKGQFICSSVWTCPVCSKSITEGRKDDIQKAFISHRVQGGGVYRIEENKIITDNETNNGIYMFTLTIPHYKKDNLKELMLNIRNAVKYFKESRAYTKALKEYGYIGEIRALEVTWCEENGWHPHFHSVFFFNQLLTDLDIQYLKNTLLPVWQNACVKAGLKKPNKTHGLDIQDGSQALNYVNKWGIENELAKWTSKRGKNGSISPFQILDLYNETNIQEKKDFLRALFNEYAEAFHGFRQLYWSPKLKAHFGINEKSDEELTEEKVTKEDIFLGSISLEEWLLLRKYKKHHQLTNTKLPFIYHIVKIVRLYGFKEVTNIINYLKQYNDLDERKLLNCEFDDIQEIENNKLHSSVYKVENKTEYLDEFYCAEEFFKAFVNNYKYVFEYYNKNPIIENTETEIKKGNLFG